MTEGVTASFSSMFMFRRHGKVHSYPGQTRLSRAFLNYGTGGAGTGGTPQIADAQDGSGGVGIRLPLPCLEGEQFGSVVGLQVMHVPVKVSMLG